MGFGQPLDAAGRMVREFLRSINYVPGSAGWNITREGDAEFSSVSIRGEVTATASDGDSQIQIKPDGTGNSAAIIFRTLSDTGLTGDAESAFVYGRQNNADQATTLVTESGISTSTDAFTSTIMEANTWTAAVQVGDGLGNFPIVNGVALTKDLTFTTKGPNSAWAPLSSLITLANGWSGTSGAFFPACKRLPWENMCQILGTIVGGTTTSGTRITTLPALYTPDADVTIPAIPNSGQACGLVIHADTGQVTILRNAGAVAFTSMHFNGIYPLSNPFPPPIVV